MKAEIGPVLYIFSGLPASGKTTLGKMLARHLQAAYLRIDTVEQGLRDLCNFKVEGEGYRLSYRIAGDNLELGTSVVADSCNTIALTRREWEETALKANARFVNIEISCSDKDEHRVRVEDRVNNIQNLKLPTWEKVENRHYEQWQENVVKIDTAGQTPAESFEALLSALVEKLTKRGSKSALSNSLPDLGKQATSRNGSCKRTGCEACADLETQRQYK